MHGDKFGQLDLSTSATRHHMRRVFFCCSRVIYFHPAYALPTPCLRRCGVFLRGDYLSWFAYACLRLPVVFWFCLRGLRVVLLWAFCWSKFFTFCLRGGRQCCQLRFCFLYFWVLLHLTSHDCCRTFCVVYVCASAESSDELCELELDEDELEDEGARAWTFRLWAWRRFLTEFVRSRRAEPHDITWLEATHHEWPSIVKMQPLKTQSRISEHLEASDTRNFMGTGKSEENPVSAEIETEEMWCELLLGVDPVPLCLINRRSTSCSIHN